MLLLVDACCVLFLICGLSFDAVCCDLCILGGLELVWYVFLLVVAGCLSFDFLFC